MVAQGRDIPAHLGTMGFTVKDFLKWVSKNDLAPGDVWFTNHPKCGGNHLPDVKAIRPIFVEGRIIAFSVSLAHWADIGGAWPGSYFVDARDSIQEGLCIPPSRLFSSDGPDHEKIRLVVANVRTSQLSQGDIFAQMAATRAAEIRIHELCNEHGTERLQTAIRELHDLAEAEMREAIRSLPNGVYKGEDFVDDGGPDGKPAAVRVTIRIEEESATFDYTQSDDATDNFLNTTPIMAVASTMYAMKVIAGPDIQPNGGCFRPVKVLTRPGSLLDPGQTKPIVGGNHETSQRVVDAIFKAFENVIPERLSAGGPTTSGLLIFGFHGKDGKWKTLYEVHGGGEGARYDRNGCHCVRVHMVNTANTPAEVIEAEYPIRIERQMLRAGSGGEGLYKGGEGIIREYQILDDNISLTTLLERRIVPPYGFCGGSSGKPYRVKHIRPDGSEIELPGKINLIVHKGDRVVIESSGGGGFGKPIVERD
jgi:N-methylhydantoinase B